VPVGLGELAAYLFFLFFRLCLVVRFIQPLYLLQAARDVLLRLFDLAGDGDPFLFAPL